MAAPQISSKKHLSVAIAFALSGVTSASIAEPIIQLWEIPAAPSGVLGGASTTSSFSVSINSDAISNLVPGQQFDVPLISGGVAQGVVATTVDEGNGNVQEVITLSDNLGSLSFDLEGETVTGVNLFEREGLKFYSAEIDSSGTGLLEQLDTDDKFCAEYPHQTSASSPIIEFGAAALDFSTVSTLQSKPGASHVIYIDFWGGTLSGTAWNSNFNNNADINYTPFSSDSNYNNFSAAELYTMWLAWREVAEDYAAFDINITTDASVFNSTPNTRKVRNVVTDTNYFYTGAGGVAYVGVYGYGNDWYQTSWTWNHSNSSMGMTISHESGHQIGLSHDGTSSQGYYRGHGNWGPIMGAPFGKKYVQWSRSSYPDAVTQGSTANENDLAIIAAHVGVDTDEASDNQAGATLLTSSDSPIEAVITFEGLGAKDTDWYSFTLDSDQLVSLSIEPLIVNENAVETKGTNFAMSAAVIDAAGDNIISLSPTENPTSDVLSLDQELAEGDYYVMITNLSPDTSPYTGFGEYGNGGWYRLQFTSESDPSGEDSTPDPFSFSSQNNVNLNTAINSNSITISGITTSVTASVSHGEFSVNGGSFSSTAQSVNNGDILQVRHNSASSGQSKTTTTLTISTVSADFTSTTARADTRPSSFKFTQARDVPKNTVVESNEVTLSGFNAPTAITIKNGEYSLNGESYTSTAGTANPGDTLKVRHTTANKSRGRLTTEVTVGGFIGKFLSLVLLDDSRPDALVYATASGVDPSTVVTSEALTISGINTAVTVTVTKGEYSLNGAAFTSINGTAHTGDTLQIRHTSSSKANGKITSSIKVGSVSSKFVSQVRNIDSRPDSFQFAAQNNVEPSAEILSTIVSPTGFNAAAAITITNGEYRVNSGAFTSAAGTLNPGDTLQVRHTSSSRAKGKITTTVKVDKVSAQLISAVRTIDTKPNTFSFSQLTNQARSTSIHSETVTITGINGPSPVKISRGEYSINGGPFTAAAGTINNGETLVVRHTTASAGNRVTVTTVKVGIVRAQFRSRTAR